MKTDIIVLGYKIPEVEERCFSSVVRNTDPGTYCFTFVDNFQSGMTLTSAWNQLISRSKCEFICLLNSDTEVYPRWLDLMLEAFNRNKWIGFVGPSTNQCHSPQKTIPSYTEALKNAGNVEIMKDPISGFCVVFRRSLWKELGGFDERYSFYGAESDFIDRAKTQKGYVCAWAKESFVYHIGERSVKKSPMNVDVERKRARELYWSTRGGKED